MRIVAICVIAALFQLCQQRPSPVVAPIRSTQASPSGNTFDSGLHEFRTDGVVVGAGWVKKWDVMVKLNNKRPDFITANRINPKKVMGLVDGDRSGMKRLDNGDYLITYETLKNFDQMNQAYKGDL